MPEFEARRTPVPPFSPPYARDHDPIDTGTGRAAPDDERPPREGLPPGYRMRHDAHYVEQLTSRATAHAQIRAIAIRDIEAPRAAEDADLEALARSIARHGIVQPLLVRPRGGRFEVIAGGRRLRAAALAGLHAVPCLVHACDDAHARALAEAERLRRDTAPAGRPSPAALPSAGLEELRQSFGSIASCLHLLADRDAPLRDRVALDLVRAEAHRAHRLVLGLHLLAGEPAAAWVEVSMRALLDEALEALAPERRLSGTEIVLDAADETGLVTGDPQWLGAALAGAIGGVLALVRSARAPVVRIRLTGGAAGTPVLVEIAQQVVTVPEWALARFFDAAWTERPGGLQAAVELAAARHAFERHGGALDVLAAERGGCRLVATLPTRGRCTP